MVDSDDEYDRRRGRDKFRRERNDFVDRNPPPRRDDWPNDGGYRSSSRNYRNDHMGGGRMPGYGRNDRYSPADRSGDISPPNKRLRGGRDWDERSPNYELGGGHHGHHGHFRGDMSWNHERDRGDDELHQPPMMTLKQFVNDQDDLDGELLISKYNDYKMEFKRAQIQEFFNRHKDEEWFRCKYYPDEIEKRKAKIQQSYQQRLDVFMELFESKYMDNISLDVDNNEQIIKVLDAVVIKLEGGTDFDLLALNHENEDKAAKDSIFAVESSSTTKASPDQKEGQTESNENLDDSKDEINEPVQESQEKSEEDESSSNAGQPKPEPMNEESGDGELIEDNEDGSVKEEGAAKSAPEMTIDEAEKKPRPLHKTCSIFFRNIAPSITRQEIEDECRKFPGFLRLAISEPQMDRRFNRRGWATYERTVNIREICWNLNNVKIRGTELSPIVNRDLTRRIRSVNGLSSHKSVVRTDIRHAAKLIMKLDAQKNLWQEDSNTGDGNGKKNGSLSAPSRNPLLKNITDYLIEEAPAEEAELLGTSVEDPLVTNDAGGEANGNAATPTDGGNHLERDEDLIKVLDRLLFYLRIVHSIDYYNHCEYPNEDEMPNRIGLIHARGLISSARVTPLEISEYIKDQENKIQPLMQATPEVTPEEAKKLGLKNIDDAVEAFIKENTKELGEGKWLCPLSNKKFMGSEFVRKHILNKHMERVEQVKSETIYFNNYILDPKRPQLPEHPLNRSPAPPAAQNPIGRHDQIGPGYGGGSVGPVGGFGSRGPLMPPPVYGHRGYVGGGPYLPPPPPPPYVVDPYSRPAFRRRYRDLDAPPED